MRLITYRYQGQIGVGLQFGERLIDLMVAWMEWQSQRSGNYLPESPPAPRDILDVLNGHPFDLHTAAEAARFPVRRRQELPSLALADIEYLPPIRRPGKLVCVGLNYPSAPGMTSGMAPGMAPADPPPYPILFHKTASTLTAHQSPILIPRISQQVEYEAELAVVIGKRGKYVSPQESWDLIAGYTIANDLGARDIQNRSSQWTSGKMLDTFCPLGPALVTADGITDPQNLDIRTTLNGEIVQDANTAEMIFDIAALVSYLSSLATLEPGDIILTGSPKRAGDKPDPRLFLQPGDVVQIEIEKLGVLANHVLAEE